MKNPTYQPLHEQVPFVGPAKDYPESRTDRSNRDNILFERNGEDEENLFPDEIEFETENKSPGIVTDEVINKRDNRWRSPLIGRNMEKTAQNFQVGDEISVDEDKYGFSKGVITGVDFESEDFKVVPIGAKMSEGDEFIYVSPGDIREASLQKNAKIEEGDEVEADIEGSQGVRLYRGTVKSISPDGIYVIFTNGDRFEFTEDEAKNVNLRKASINRKAAKNSLDLLGIKKKTPMKPVDLKENRAMRDTFQGEALYGDDKPLNRSIQNVKGRIAELKEIKVGDQVIVNKGIEKVSKIASNGITTRNFYNGFESFHEGKSFNLYSKAEKVVDEQKAKVKLASSNRKEKLFFQNEREDKLFPKEDDTVFSGR